MADIDFHSPNSSEARGDRPNTGGIEISVFADLARETFDQLDSNLNNYVSRKELDSAAQDPRLHGNDKLVVDSLRKGRDIIQGLSNDEFASDDDGITIGDLNEMEKLLRLEDVRLKAASKADKIFAGNPAVPEGYLDPLKQELSYGTSFDSASQFLTVLQNSTVHPEDVVRSNSMYRVLDPYGDEFESNPNWKPKLESAFVNLDPATNKVKSFDTVSSTGISGATYELDEDDKVRGITQWDKEKGTEQNIVFDENGKAISHTLQKDGEVIPQNPDSSMKVVTEHGDAGMTIKFETGDQSTKFEFNSDGALQSKEHQRSIYSSTTRFDDLGNATSSVEVLELDGAHGIKASEAGLNGIKIVERTTPESVVIDQFNGDGKLTASNTKTAEEETATTFNDDGSLDKNTLTADGVLTNQSVNADKQSIRFQSVDLWNGEINRVYEDSAGDTHRSRVTRTGFEIQDLNDEGDWITAKSQFKPRVRDW